MQETFGGGCECVKRVQCSWDIHFLLSSLNFPLMISHLTLLPFFHVPAPTKKIPGEIVTGRHALGVCNPAGEGHGAMTGELGKTEGLGYWAAGLQSTAEAVMMKLLICVIEFNIS